MNVIKFFLITGNRSDILETKKSLNLSILCRVSNRKQIVSHFTALKFKFFDFNTTNENYLIKMWY